MIKVSELPDMIREMSSVTFYLLPQVTSSTQVGTKVIGHDISLAGEPAYRKAFNALIFRKNSTFERSIFWN